MPSSDGMDAADASQVNAEISSREASSARCITMPTVIGSENKQKNVLWANTQKSNSRGAQFSPMRNIASFTVFLC